MPRLALICPVHNCPEYTQAMLASINFFDNKLKIYIIDNGSTEQNSQALMKMMHKVNFSYIPFFFNHGVASAWNRGITAAISDNIDYYLITNNDVVFRDDTLINLFTHYTTNHVDLLSAYNIHKQYYTPQMALYYHYGSVTNQSVPLHICQLSQYQANQKRFVAKWGHLPVQNAHQAQSAV